MWHSLRPCRKGDNMVIWSMKSECIPFGNDKHCTPLLKRLREKSRKRSVYDAFGETTDALVHLDLSPRVKRVVRRPPPMLTVYVRKENEKAYNAIFMETVTVDDFKEAVSECYGLKGTSIQRVSLRDKSGEDKEIDEQCLKTFVDEDDFLISLDYDSTKGYCDIVLVSNS